MLLPVAGLGIFPSVLRCFVAMRVFLCGAEVEPRTLCLLSFTTGLHPRYQEQVLRVQPAYVHHYSETLSFPAFLLVLVVLGDENRAFH